MIFFAVSRNKLSLMTLFAAGTLSASTLFAAETPAREQISVDSEAALRAVLSERYQPDGTAEESDRKFHSNADVTLAGDISVTTIRTEEIKDTDGNITGTTTFADNVVNVLADNVKILGGGFEIASSSISLDVNGSGDLFFLDGVTLSVENITFAGTTDATKKTGRVFTTGNSLQTKINIGAGTVFENRRLVADGKTNYRA
ncbi:MAG: hypothetical protein IJX22_04820, partial [Opitutales bacterium]|nr:hypothetical protein [Opitutales bacterium]